MHRSFVQPVNYGNARCARLPQSPISFIWIPDFLKQNFKWGTMYFFDMVQGGAVPFKIWNTLPENQRPRKPLILVENTYDGTQICNLWKAIAPKYGYTNTVNDTIELGCKDFSELLIKVKSMKVDAILMFANIDESVTIIRQMKKYHINVKFFQGIKGTWPTKFYKSLGNDAEYILCDGFWSEDFPFTGEKNLGERYRQEFGKHSVSVGMYYALCQILWQAIEKAGTLDSSKIRQTVLDNKFDTMMGKVDYDDRGIALFPLAFFQWRKGNQEIIYPFNYSKYKLQVRYCQMLCMKNLHAATLMPSTNFTPSIKSPKR